MDLDRSTRKRDATDHTLSVPGRKGAARRRHVAPVEDRPAVGAEGRYVSPRLVRELRQLCRSAATV